METRIPKTPSFDNRGRKNATSATGIIDPRSESRKQFGHIQLKDPREKLSEQQIKAAKERRQANIKENREERKLKTSEEQKMANLNRKQLTTMIQQMTEAMKDYEEATRKEIENIMKIVNLKFSKMEKEQKQITTLWEQMKDKLIKAENIINDSEELFQKSILNSTRRHRCGIAMMKSAEGIYTRIPLIPRWRFNKYKRTWIKEYWIHNSKGTYKYREFYKENKEFIIEGRINIIKAIRIHKQNKDRSMKEYRERQNRLIEQRISEINI